MFFATCIPDNSKCTFETNLNNVNITMENKLSYSLNFKG